MDDGSGLVLLVIELFSYIIDDLLLLFTAPNVRICPVLGLFSPLMAGNEGSV
jgi:hypothetical protein